MMPFRRAQADDDGEGIRRLNGAQSAHLHAGEEKNEHNPERAPATRAAAPTVCPRTRTDSKTSSSSTSSKNRRTQPAPSSAFIGVLIGALILVTVADKFVGKKAFTKWAQVVPNFRPGAGSDENHLDYNDPMVVKTHGKDWATFVTNLMNLVYVAVLACAVWPRVLFPDCSSSSCRSGGSRKTGGSAGYEDADIPLFREGTDGDADHDDEFRLELDEEQGDEDEREGRRRSIRGAPPSWSTSSSRSCSSWWRISAESRAVFPFYVYLIVAALDASANLACALGQRTPGTVQPMLDQVQLPLVAVLSVWFLRKKYTVVQYLAMLLIVGGAVLAIPGRGVADRPILRLPNADPKLPAAPTEINVNVNVLLTENEAEDEATEGGNWKWMLLYVLRPVFFAIASVYKESCMRDAEERNAKLDVFWFAFWVNFSQLFITLPLMLLNSIPAGLGRADGARENDLGDHEIGTLSCSPSCAALHHSTPNDPASDFKEVFADGFQCFFALESGIASRFCSEHSLGLWPTLYALVNLLYSLLLLFLLKLAGATVASTVVNGISIPLASGFFFLCLWEDSRSPFSVRERWVDGWTDPNLAGWRRSSWYLVAGVALVLAGFLLYNLCEPRSRTSRRPSSSSSWQEEEAPRRPSSRRTKTEVDNEPWGQERLLASSNAEAVQCGGQEENSADNAVLIKFWRCTEKITTYT